MDQSWQSLLKTLYQTLTVDTLNGPSLIRAFPEWETVLNSGAPNKLIVAGEGSGKSMHAGLYLTARTIYDLQWGKHLYWVVGADYEDARKDFDYFVEFQQQIDAIETLSRPTHRDQQCTLVTRTGHTIVTISSYDFTKIARDEPFGIVGAEVSRWFPETFERCEGRLLRNYPYAWE